MMFLFGLIALVVKGRTLHVRRVWPDRAVLGGFGEAFLNTAEFDFDRGITSGTSGRGFDVIPK